jgi:hypothetical protein
MTITVKLSGGLGNQLFQYACARNIAENNHTDLKLDTSFYDTNENPQLSYGMDYFNKNASIATKKELLPHSGFVSQSIFKILKPKRYIQEKHFEFDPTIENLKDGSYLDGYWQSENYFKNINQIIKKELTLVEPLVGRNLNMANRIKSCESVSIHVRRGDYVTNGKTNTLHGICSPEYYETSIKLIKQKIGDPVFFIFSDDLEWIHKYMITGYPQIIVDINKSNDAHEDLRLMSLCKHHVIANSTFSWWGAWLSDNPDKIVIAPEKWFDQYNLNTKDLIPERWVRI